MHLSQNIFKTVPSYLFFIFIATSSGLSSQGLDELKLSWDFKGGMEFLYSVKQTSKIQNYVLQKDGTTVSGLPIHVETVSGQFTLVSLPDGNANGNLVLTLEGIKENEKSLAVPAEQMIPQRVARFILTPEGYMEEYVGPRKETYMLSRMIFGLPVHALKQNQIRAYPIQLFTKADNTRSNVTGTISHELNSIELYNEKYCARIITTIDLRDAPGNDESVKSIWKGIGTGLFNIADKRLEKMTFELAVKKQFNEGNSLNLVQVVEIYEVEIKLIENRVQSK